MSKKRMPLSLAVIVLAAALFGACSSPAPAAPTAAKPTAAGAAQPAAAPTAPAAAPAAATKSVKIGALFSLTGAAVQTTGPISQAAWAYFRYVNEKQGGLTYNDPKTGKSEKVTLDLVWKDIGYDAGKAAQGYTEMNDAKPLIAVQVGQTPATVKPASRDGLAMIGVADFNDEVRAVKPATTATVYPGYRPMLFSFLKNFREQWKGANDPSVLMFMADIPLFKAIVTGAPEYGAIGAPEYAKSINVKWLDPEVLPLSATSAAVEVQRGLSKKPDIVVLETTIPLGSVVLNDAFRAGLWDKTKWFTHGGIMAPPLWTVSDPKIIEGLAAPMWNLPVAGDLPEAKLLRDSYSAFFNAQATDNTVMGWIAAKVQVAAVKSALEKVGYEGLTRQAVLDAFMSLKGVDLGGLAPAAGISPEKPVLLQQERMFEARNGALVATGDWFPIDVAK